MTESPADAVAVLRGINVGGHTARKEQLVAAAHAVGLDGVSTFLASGNVLFAAHPSADTAHLEGALSTAFEAELGFAVDVFVRTKAQLGKVAGRSPFTALDMTAGTLQIGFLHRAPTRAAKAEILALGSDVDHLAAVGNQLYWHTAAGVSDSPLFKGPTLDRAIGQAVTWRNVNTVRRLSDRLAS